MSTFYESDYTKIEDINQLVEKYHRACKSPEQFQVGLEVEKLPITKDYTPLPYRNPSGPSVEQILFRIRDAYGAEEIQEEGKTIALQLSQGMIALEPGGQVEFGMAPYGTLKEIEEDLARFLKTLQQISIDLDIKWWNLGFHPLAKTEEMPWMPKERYNLMRDYMPQRAPKALEMMTQSASLQASFDYSTEEEMIANFRLAQGLNPLLIALYANSPFKEGLFTGYHSYRTKVWDYTDPDRCGLIERVFLEGFSFRDYTEFLLDVPMLFLLRDNQWINTGGLTFRQFWQKGYQGMEATMGDWELHSTGLFTEVRLRPWMEVRTPDLPPDKCILSYPAFLKGLFYDETARREAWERLGKPEFSWVLKAREEAALHSLEGRYGEEPMQNLAMDLLEISKKGLERQKNPEDSGYLEILFAQVKEKKSPAIYILDESCCEGKFSLSGPCAECMEVKQGK